MVGTPEKVIVQFLGVSLGVPGTPGSGDNYDGFYSTGLRAATAAELQVWLEKSDGIPVLQQPGSDYTLDLTNPACAVIGFDTTGGLPQPPYPVLPAPGDIITCVRLTSLTQTLNLRYNERLPSALLEASLDKILRLIADTRGVKTLRFPVTDPLDQPCEIPGSWARAGRVLGFDDGGDLTVYPVVEIGESATTAYRGDLGKVAYYHSQVPHAPADATKGADWDVNVTNKPTLLGLGQTESTAFRGDHGHAAHQHAISEHAPMPGTAAAKDVEFFATAAQGVDERVPTEAGLANKFGEINKPTPVDADRFCGINKQGPLNLNHPFHTTWAQIKAFFATPVQGALADSAIQPEAVTAQINADAQNNVIADHGGVLDTGVYVAVFSPLNKGPVTFAKMGAAAFFASMWANFSSSLADIFPVKLTALTDGDKFLITDSAINPWNPPRHVSWATMKAGLTPEPWVYISASAYAALTTEVQENGTVYDIYPDPPA